MAHDGLLPLYEQVRRRILSEIGAGRLAEGSFLPSEFELCETYGVSRITLRRAVGELCAEGLLIRQQGRGTLVAPRKMQQTISLSGFADVVEGQGRKAGHRVLDSEDQPDAPVIAARLQASRLIRFLRLLEMDDRAMTLETLYFDAERFADAHSPVVAGKSFFATLRRAYGVEPAGAERLIDVGFARASEAELLGVSTTEPVYRIDKLVLDAAGNPLALSQTVTPCHLVTLAVKN
ncbi:GntR family transcriptional regulator [Nitratireductor soli]|uniref:GntR family transcriptional regulator n=1 Tax=Nitratireductor soli TaxID=1670619 RepID=UPI00065E7D8D|nr:GntR family transcriptional regulator [Nitratireductor soli]